VTVLGVAPVAEPERGAFGAVEVVDVEDLSVLEEFLGAARLG